MQLTIPNVFQNGTGEANIIDAPKMNANFSAAATVLNGNLADDNVLAGSKILVSDRSYTGASKITGTFEFSAFPTVPDASVPDGKLSANVPLKNAANVFSVQQKFSGGVDCDHQQVVNFKAEEVSSLPVWTAADKGRILRVTGDDKSYIGGNSGWLQIDYVGGYTGGAIRSYAYTGLTDDGDGCKHYFKTEGASPTVKIVLKGEPFPKRFYTELAYHTHAFTGVAHLHTISDAGHTHYVTLGSHGHGAALYALSTHTHGISGSTGVQSANHTHLVSGTSANENSHTHTLVQEGSGSSGAGSLHYHVVNITSEGTSADHTHTISLTTGSSSSNQASPSENLGSKDSSSSTTGISINANTAAGSNAYAGVNIGASLSATQKLYGKGLIVTIDGTDVTSSILTATGWAAIGDGTGTHAFHTSGTGELTASAWKTYTAGLHTIEITEPESGYGCQAMIHIETY